MRKPTGLRKVTAGRAALLSDGGRVARTPSPPLYTLRVPMVSCGVARFQSVPPRLPPQVRIKIRATLDAQGERIVPTAAGAETPPSQEKTWAPSATYPPTPTRG